MVVMIPVKILEYIKLALLEIWYNKVRTLLTLLGIIIGITSVITIIFVVQGTEDFVLNEFEKIIPLDVIMARSEYDSRSYEPLVDFTYDDLKNIRQQDDFRALTMEKQHNLEVRAPHNKEEATVIGTSGDFLVIQDLELLQGRFFNSIDLKNHRRVVVLEEEIARDLFPGKNPLGEKIYFDNHSFRVIGVFGEEESSFFGSFFGDRIIIPVTSYSRLRQKQEQPTIYARFAEEMPLTAAVSRLQEILDDHYGLTAEGDSRFFVRELGMVDGLEVITIGLMILLGGVASLTLVVAGIGVMNIMLVIVTERTKEVGLRKALGATRGSIMLQFLIESVILCLVGGVFGVLGGYAASSAVLDFAHSMIELDIQPAVPLWAVFLALLFTCGVGLFFGIYPAYKASKLDPIVALEQE